MGTVSELFDVFPFDTVPRNLKRDELALLSPAVPGMPGVRWDPIPPLDVIHFPQEYIDGAFVPPRILWEGAKGRIELQQMDFRQPMYHRNLDADEMSFQIFGERTLMTEFGSVELAPGDMVRIPVGVAHDNWGRRAGHMLWYFPAPIHDVGPVDRYTDVLLPPFEGWEPAIVNEVHTDCLGGRHCDRAVQLSDERLILEQGLSEAERLAVMRAEAQGSGTQWVFRGVDHAIGVTETSETDGRVYTRHRNVEEVQYQVEGTRLLVSANGVVEMKPGTFVHVPIGVAFTSIVEGHSKHLTTVTTDKLDCVWPDATQSTTWSLDEIESYRQRVSVDAAR